MFSEIKRKISFLFFCNIVLLSIFFCCTPGIAVAQSNFGGPTCDITQGCYIFSYKGYIRNADGTVTLNIEVTNTCKYDVSYIAFELPARPAGQPLLQAKNPQNSNSQFSYNIDNTTNNPFYGCLKFSPNGKDYVSGASDIFSYAIPAADFDAMTSFQVQAHSGSNLETVSFNPKGCCTNQVAISGPAAVCPNTQQTYSVSPINGVSFYEWTVPAGWQIMRGQGTRTVTVKPNSQAGDVKLQQGIASCGTTPVTTLPNFIAPPTALTGPAVVCANATYTYEVPAVANALSYNWTVPSGWQILSTPGNNGYGRTISVKAGTSSGYIKVAAVGACVSSAILSAGISIEAPVTLNGGISGNANPCVGSTQVYTISAANASVYTWTLPAGYSLVSGQGSNTVTVITGSAAGNLSVAIQSPNGCSSISSSLNLTPIPLPVISQNPVSVTASKGSNVTFSVNATGSNLSYQWQANNGSGWVDLVNNGIYSQANSAALQLTAIPIYLNGYQFRAVVTGCSQQVISAPATLTVNPAGVVANIKIFLEGPYNAGNGLMNTNLNLANLLPTTQPYNNNFWNYSGNEMLQNGFFAANPGIVDWVLVELRTGTTPSTKITTQACLLKNNGSVVDLDGVSLPSFPGIQAGSYYIIVHHRVHLSVMSKTLQVLNNNSPVYDFTTSYKMASGINPVKKMANGKWAMFTGDANSNGSVTTSDWGSYWMLEKGQRGYMKADWNLDGIVDQTDYSFWYVNGGFTTQVLR